MPRQTLDEKITPLHHGMTELTNRMDILEGNLDFASNELQNKLEAVTARVRQLEIGSSTPQREQELEGKFKDLQSMDISRLIINSAETSAEF